MLYELIADSARVVAAIERDFSDRAPVRFLILDTETETETDTDPLCDDSRYGERLCEGFSLLNGGE